MLYAVIVDKLMVDIFIFSIWLISTFIYYKITDFITTNIVLYEDKIWFRKPLRFIGVREISFNYNNIDYIEIRIQSYGTVTVYYSGNKRKTIGVNLGNKKRKILFNSLDNIFVDKVKVLSYYDKDITHKYKNVH
jgi:hypothetical protein